MALEAGLTGEVEHTTTQRDTAVALGSGDVEVLGTPAVVALCEQAAVAALRDHLPPGHTSVGTRVELDHLAPTAPGARVVARAHLVQTDGRRLVFSVDVHEGDHLVARGSHTRVVVDRERFAAGAARD